jgi:hypothetical protein
MAGIEIKVNSGPITISEKIDIQANIYKPIEAVRYSKYADKDSVTVAYFESKELFSEDSVVLEDHSIFSSYNDRRNIDEQICKKYNELVFTSKYKEILITFVEGTSFKGTEVTPLFYKQKDCQDVVAVTVEKITNKSESVETVNFGHAIVSGEIYYNYENSYNAITGEYTLYYLTISYQDGGSDRRILNPTKAIEEATYETLTSSKITYSRRYRNQYYSYRIILPEDKTIASYICSNNSGEVSFYVKELEKNSIYLKKPRNQSIKNEWFAEVNNGEVYSVVDSVYRKYSIPEYSNQGFSVKHGFLYVKDKECSVINNLHLQLPYKNIYANNLAEDIKIYKYDIDNKLVDGEPLSVLYIDETTGIVRLEESIQENVEYIFKAEFHYRTDSFVLNQFNLNPYMNPEAIYETYHVYVKPNESRRSVQVFKASELSNLPEIAESWLYLGSMNYEEDYDIEQSLSFQLNNNKRFVSEEDSFSKNPYILQSKYGYGNNGQKLQKNNIVIVDVPASYEAEDFYTEKELYTLFKRKLKPSTNLVINYVDDMPKLELVSNEGESIEVSCSWEGLGTYQLYREDSSSPGKNNIDTYNNIPTGRYEISFTDATVVSGTTYTYTISYNSKVSKRTLRVKAR